jgi:acetoin utilization protein AcuB
MLVDDIAQKELVTVSPSATLGAVLHLLSRRGVRHVMVVQGTRLVGIISDRDVKVELALSAGVELAGQRRNAAQVMTRDPITIAPTTSVADAARRMLTARVSALPVVRDGRVIGIVTETDLLRVLASEPAASTLR